MTAFQKGETIICYLEVKKSGAYYDPTSVLISIYLPTGVVDVNEAAMYKEDIGKYSYTYQTSGKAAGAYWVRFTGKDGNKITIKDDSFRLSGDIK